MTNSLYTLPIIKPPLAQAESDSLLSLNNNNSSNRSSTSPQAPPIASRPEKTKSIVSIIFTLSLSLSLSLSFSHICFIIIKSIQNRLI